MNLDKLSFLVVEDHGFQLWIIGKMLEDMGARQVLRANGGTHALDLLAERNPPIDIIVSDIDMPGMDGMELIRHLAGAKYPASVILASALDRKVLAGIETMARAYGVPILAVIPKPITARKLQSAIAAYEGRRLAPSPSQDFSVEEIASGMRHGEFEAFFQPKVDAVTGIVVGAEALARWRHPELGIVRPAAFLSSAESSGMIEPLTFKLLELATANCSRWRNADIDATVSINLSAGSLSSMEFADRLRRIVHGSGLQPRHVVLEVTESQAALDDGRLLENLARLRMKGFGLSIDDYGTGHSSMERLAAVAFTELKIDQSFVRGALTDPSSRAMLESGLEMAKKLRITSVAEGIQSRAELELVRGLGCDVAQGYFIGKPMDASQFQVWLQMPQRVTA